MYCRTRIYIYICANETNKQDGKAKNNKRKSFSKISKMGK